MDKQLPVFILEVWREHSLAHVVLYFARRPKAASAQFLLAWLHVAVVHAAEHVHKLTLLFALKDIMAKWLRDEAGYAKFLAHLSPERLVHVLAQVDVSPDGGIPFVGLYVFPRWPVLKVKLTLAVEHVQVDHGVQYLAAVVGMATAYRPEYVAVLIHYGELFVWIVSHDYDACYVA